MLKKTVISSAIVSVLLLSFSGIAPSAAKDKLNTPDTVSSHHVNTGDMYGEIIGGFNSPDGTVVGATLPGKNVIFSIPVKKNGKQYLHFAFMHAGSASEGWFFAPESENGIELSELLGKKEKTIDITKYIALFRSPAANQVDKVTADKGKLIYGTADKFLTATLSRKDAMFVINIKNISDKEFATPFSSGVWGVTKAAEKSFDHTPSSALSTLATTGHRGELYQSVKKQLTH